MVKIQLCQILCRFQFDGFLLRPYIEAGFLACQPCRLDLVVRPLGIRGINGAVFIADAAGLATSLHIACRWAEVLGRFAVDTLRFKAAMIDAGGVALHTQHLGAPAEAGRCFEKDGCIALTLGGRGEGVQLRRQADPARGPASVRRTARSTATRPARSSRQRAARAESVATPQAVRGHCG